MNVLDLFSGIGGFSLGLERAGMRTVAFCEIEPYPRAILAKHWPGVPCYDDVRTLNIDVLANGWNNALPEAERERRDMVARKKDYDEAVSLYDRGLSIADVAAFYGITRQAMWDILRRRGCVFRPQLRYGTDNHFHRGTSADDRAQNTLETAMSKGIVTRRDVCETCGAHGRMKDGRSIVQAHHHDYNKPLDVTWLCQRCHHEWHKNHRAVPRKEVEDGIPEAIDVICGGFP